jgi:drug/metabolite transporter (DMT)-like permease
MWITVGILTIGLFAYASGAIFVRLAMTFEGQDGPGFSLFLAAARMGLTVLFCLPAWRGFRRAHYHHKSCLHSVMAGVFLALYFATWLTSLGFTSIAASTTLVNLNPLWVIGLSWLWLRHVPRRGTLCGAGLATTGAIMISLGAKAIMGASYAVNVGNWLALIGSIAVAAYILLGHVAQKNPLPLRHHLVLMYSTAALVLLPMPMMLGTSFLGYKPQTYGCIILMALITQLLGHTCLNWSVKWVNPALVSILLLTEPIVASGLGYWVFREVPSFNVVMGGSIVLIGVAIAILCQESIRPLAICEGLGKIVDRLKQGLRACLMSR